MDLPKSSSRVFPPERLENLYGQAIRLSIGGPKNPEAQAKRRSSDRKLQKTNAIGEVSGPKFNHEPPLDRISSVCFDR
jgi:hypothetical protein